MLLLFTLSSMDQQPTMNEENRELEGVYQPTAGIAKCCICSFTSLVNSSETTNAQRDLLVHEFLSYDVVVVTTYESMKWQFNRYRAICGVGSTFNTLSLTTQRAQN